MRRASTKRTAAVHAAVWLGSAVALFLVAVVPATVLVALLGSPSADQIVVVLGGAVLLVLVPALGLALLLGAIDIGLLIAFKDAARTPPLIRALVPTSAIVVIAAGTVSLYASAVTLRASTTGEYYAIGTILAGVIAVPVLWSHLRFARRRALPREQ